MYIAACMLLCLKRRCETALLSCREGCYLESEMLVGQQEIRRRLLWSGQGEGYWKSECKN